jgi:plasmid replication initiation protein
MPTTKTDANTTNRYIVTQHNSLVEANYSTNLSARALKVARLLISGLSPDTQKLEHIDIDIAALKRFLGYTEGTTWGRFHDDLKDIAKRLNHEPIEISLGKKDTLVSFFISSYRLNIPAGKITFHISPELAPYLLQLKQSYTSYLLSNIPKLRSSYSIRFYELLTQYRKFGKRSFELNDLQKKVGSSYAKYNHFKDKVIKQAQKDLKKHTDLHFVFHEKKEGRKVTGIEFIIFGNKPISKSPNQLSLLENAIEQDGEREKPALPETIITAMNELGISEQNIAKYLAMGFDIIEEKKKRAEVIKRCETLQNYYLEKLELTKQSATSENAAGYFIKALKEDWVHSKSLQKAKAENAAKERSKAAKKLRTITVTIEKLSKQKETIKTLIIAELLADDATLEKAYNTAMKGLGNFIKGQISDILHLPIRKQYEKSIHVSSRVGVYLFEQYPERFEEVNNITKQVELAQKEIQEIKNKYPSIK